MNEEIFIPITFFGMVIGIIWLFQHFALKKRIEAVIGEGGRLLRFWLSGELNLNQIGIGKDGANKYVVLNETIR